MPKPFIVKSVLAAVRSIPDHKQFRVLDLSCGQGEVIAELHGEVGAIEGTHYKSNDYIVKNPLPILSELKIHDNISLAEELPFESESYDLVIMTEVLEHLPDHFLAMQAVSRIVKPGGYLIVTTPNTARIHSRFSFFLTGANKIIRERIGWDMDIARLHEFHINMVDFPTFHALLHLLGHSICSIRCTKVKKRHLALLLFYPLIWIASVREYCRPLGTPLHNKGELDLFRKMTSFPLMCSEQLLIITRKARE